jgi:hypothetical protein
MMLLTIDGKPVPTSQRSYRMAPTYDTTMAMFILQNLKPDSVIGWMDLEGLGQPTYEGLMIYAKIALPFWREIPKPVRYNLNPEMRVAVLAVCRFQQRAKRAEYLTHEIMQEINDTRSKKSKSEVAEAYAKLRGEPYMIIDSIPQDDYAGKILHSTPNGIGVMPFNSQKFGRIKRHGTGA